MKISVGLAVLLLVAAVSSAPQGDQTTPIAIVSESSDIQPDGSFKYAYETANGIKVQDEGTIKTVDVPKQDGTGTEQASVSVQSGSFTYNSPDGTPITLQWTADENGFHPTGAHLPVAPTAV